MPPDAAIHPLPPARPFTHGNWAGLAAVGVAAFALYARTAAYGFIYLDDQAYVAANPYVQHGLSWAGVRWACTATVVDNWHPLTLLLELALSTLFGPHARTFHLANAVLHGATTSLLFGFLRSATGRAGPALAAAALWAFHPLRVESVAWVAELKDVLSGACWVACLWAYVGYARRRTPGRYAAVAGLFMLALLSKPIAVTLPFVLLLVDYWPVGGGTVRWWRDRALEKLPLLALSAVTAWVTVRAQPTPATLVSIPLRVRGGNAIVSTLAYLRQSFWPTGLGLFYPHPWVLRQPIPTATVAASAALLLAITVTVFAVARRHRYLPVGWLWFLGVLVPVIGLLQAGDQARADRFTFLPGMGLTIAVVWLVADWAGTDPGRRRIATAAATVAAAALAAGTTALVPTWRSVDTVWARADAVIPHNYFAKAMLAQMAVQDGDLPRAERLARASIAIAPRTISDGHVALALVLDARGRSADAAAEFATAVRIAPNDPLLRYLAGRSLLRQPGQGDAARAQLAAAVHLDPALAAARQLLGLSLLHDGRAADAADQLRQLLAIAPHDGLAEAALADALRLNGDNAGAIRYRAAAVADGVDPPDWRAGWARLTIAPFPTSSPTESAHP